MCACVYMHPCACRHVPCGVPGHHEPHLPQRRGRHELLSHPLLHQVSEGCRSPCCWRRSCLGRLATPAWSGQLSHELVCLPSRNLEPQPSLNLCLCLAGTFPQSPSTPWRQLRWRWQQRHTSPTGWPWLWCSRRQARQQGWCPSTAPLCPWSWSPHNRPPSHGVALPSARCVRVSIDQGPALPLLCCCFHPTDCQR